MNLTLIGYWWSEDGRSDEWPDVRDLVDATWDQEERHMVRTYVCSGTIARAYLGLSSCRLCGQHNGSILYTDGVYAWPEGLVHYIDEHDVRLPQPFVDYVVRRLDEIEAASVNSDWWRSQGARHGPAPSAPDQ